MNDERVVRPEERPSATGRVIVVVHGGSPWSSFVAGPMLSATPWRGIEERSCGLVTAASGLYYRSDGSRLRVEGALMRQDVEFTSAGLTLRGWLYRPDGVTGTGPLS